MRQRKENLYMFERQNVEIDGVKRRKLELQTSDRALKIFCCENEEEAGMSGFYDS